MTVRITQTVTLSHGSYTEGDVLNLQQSIERDLVVRGFAVIVDTIDTTSGSDDVSVLDYPGVDPTGVFDSTPAFVAALSAGKRVLVPEGTYLITSLALGTEDVLVGEGYGTQLRVSGGITITDARKAGMRKMTVQLTTASTTLLRLQKGAGVGSFESYFEDVVFLGDIGNASTVGIHITDSYINTFVNCHFIDFDTCIRHGIEANRNNYFGCTIRARTTYGTRLLEQTAGHANSFVGCDLENCNRIMEVSGGSVFFDSGCYFEAHNDAFGIRVSGGHVGISQSYFNEVFIRIAAGGSLSLAKNWIKASSNSTTTFPVIRLLTGYARLILDNNILEGTTYLARLDPAATNFMQVYNEGTSSWGSEYPSTQHISIADNIYDVTAAVIQHATVSNTRVVRNRGQQFTEGRVRMDGGSNGVQLLSSTWNYNALRMGAYYLWVDATGDLRISNGAPASDTAGTVVGTQT